MEATLIVVEGEAQAPQFNVNLPAIIGRSRNADVKLGHPLVSRQHCELFEADGYLMVRDLGSLNGTYVGDTRIANEVSLEPGGLFTIGSVTFRAQYQQPERAAEPEGAAVGFAPLADEMEEGVGEETIQAGGLDDLGQMQDAHQAAEAPDGFGWLEENTEAESAAVAEAGAPPAEEEEELSFGEVEIAEGAPADEPAAQEAGMDDFNLNFDDPDDTQAAPPAAKAAEPEVAAPEMAEPEVAAPAEEEEFNFAPPAEEGEPAEGQVDDGDLDDFFKNLK